ncbi:MAG: hypothetical protein B6241_02630 [Spirochaetaceae bacterium 4572_59]|nr:MAG: hypothetical protein B6241_02630 [Spirochaetaceae bacterium 4572_59]
MGSEHGGLDYAKLRSEGISPDDILDFSVSINPDPLPERVLKRIRQSCITRYPDSGCELLREKIAKYNNLNNTDSILVVNGTSQGMHLIVQALLEQDETVCIVTPTYSEYYDACSLKTDKINLIEMKSDKGFHFDIPLITEQLKAKEPRLLWLCSPNNPTGNYLTEKEFKEICHTCLQTGTTFILDEAYICFVAEKLRYNSIRENVIILRSMTKDFSIPGLRLGYLMGDPALISRIKHWQPEWSISGPAQDAGSACFEEIDYFKNSWKNTSSKMKNMMKDLEALGFQTFPSCSNFFLLKVSDRDALKDHLWKDLILVRDCASFHLDNFIRIGIGTDKANLKLLNSIREYREG